VADVTVADVTADAVVAERGIEIAAARTPAARTCPRRVGRALRIIMAPHDAARQAAIRRCGWQVVPYPVASRHML
jgi:hypothetical protein